ncbi:MAG: hypothetical protein CMJ58_19280 [Planctomycetaceae bacterium]|nr:hypothetical protein [Planctomycetaceae bacterium]
MVRTLSFLLAVLGLAIGAQQTTAVEPVSLTSLLKEMVDRDAVARFPDPAYTCRQASSYDRASVSADDPATWYANNDRSQFVRIEERDGRKEFVLMDEQGPGAIVRFWATWHGPGGGPFSDGTLRFYFDGSDTPAIEGPASEVLDRGLLCGPPLSQGVSPQTPHAQRGHNLYLPIPYAKSCKITYSTDVLMDIGAVRGEALYYQINYRTYEEGTPVETFSMDGLAAAKELIEETNELLQAGAAGDGLASQASGWSKRDPLTKDLAPGAATDAARLTGSGAIRRLSCQLEAENLPQALRSTVLEITCDGEQTVWCPVGEFCGMGYQVRPNHTWYTNATEDGRLEATWVMPYALEATVRLRNLGQQPVRIVGATIETSPWEWDGRSMHFHATWHQLTKATTRRDAAGEPRPYDVNYVSVEGQGVYLGDTLTVCNGAAAWWGEGDEKIYVDGEQFPSHFGTGTEDYYGYAWCRPEKFAAPWHAQPEGDGNNNGGYSVNCRFRSLDAIPFHDSLQFDMELWHWADTKVNYAPTTFWYALPSAESNVDPAADIAALPVGLEAEDVAPPYRVDGAVEGEQLKIVEATGGKHSVQHGVLNWSDARQLWWIDAAPGDRLVVEFPVEAAGSHSVAANVTKAVDYGIVAISVNDDPPVKFDGYSAELGVDTVSLGAHELRKGTNRLTIEIIGAHADAVPRRMFGLDYLLVQ